MKALVIANGELPSVSTIRRLAADADLILVTDGAAARTECDLEISFICGDFDSIDRETARLRYPGAQIADLSDQDSSDLEKTIAFAMGKGATEFVVAGGLGGRIDHTLVLISLLMRYHRSVKISVVDDSSELIFLSPGCYNGGSLCRIFEPDATLSLISFATETSVSISGVRWPLEQYRLEPGSRGVSNRALGGQVLVNVHQGIAALSSPVAIPDSQSRQTPG